MQPSIFWRCSSESESSTTRTAATPPEGFVNVAFLLGVAEEFDSRSAVSADLGLDGKVDLVVTGETLMGQRSTTVSPRSHRPGLSSLG